MSLIELQESAKAGKLVVVCGAGLSMALADPKNPAPSWTAMIENGLRFGEAKGLISTDQVTRWGAAVVSGDIDDLLGAAQFVFRKLKGPTDVLYERWLEREFSKIAPKPGKMHAAVKKLSDRRLPICTLNYDTLIEQTVGQPGLTMKDARSVMNWARGQSDGILHLHGVWSDPSTCILGISDYDSIIGDEFRNNLQRSLSSFNRLLFVGCGDTLKDPNLSSLIAWMKNYVGASALQHYSLVKDEDFEIFNADPQYHGFVEPISYGRTFDDLPAFLESITDKVAKRPNSNRSQVEASVVNSYREYVIRDCGKMTIEGMAADADTAKQRFDIEQLFVPLSVDGIPPDFAANDANREEKLRIWAEENGERVPFGNALRKNRRLALLALPGGGKTLLLKRLAVAYADNERRTKTNDALPKSDLLPILIRCREWRDHIRLPIGSIIDRIGDITGQPELNGLYAATKPRFQSGKVLLLVDGLDEIHNDADRTIFVEHLEIFLNDHPKARLVVTSREAGFSLVAPNITRFCSKWRVAPLDDEAIRLLCCHWHSLMSGGSAEAMAEAEIVIQTIESNDALKRLSENPLLLTMLLVVKHGYGRLPPDRVALYERAVDVLLDTWNIKGHAALNPKEAVPQLAYVALRMMKSGQQTVTERQLLTMLQECRERVDIVKLYAKDSPAEFLERVELRSSLLLEAGRVIEKGKAVSFYQFRHLTFQEYLASVACVEGNYDDYKQGDSPLAPLQKELLSEDWKEVIPMVAVLGRKQSEPLIQALLDDSLSIEAQALDNKFVDPSYSWSGNHRMPPSTSRLIQCLIEEAEFSANSLKDTLRVVSTLAQGCIGSENWQALLRGPFGDAICEESWRLYRSDLPRRSWIRNTAAVFRGLRYGPTVKEASEYVPALKAQLLSRNPDDHGRAAAAICGIIWRGSTDAAPELMKLCPLLERTLDPANLELFEMTAWAIGLTQARVVDDTGQPHRANDKTLNLLVSQWEQDPEMSSGRPVIGAFALSRTLMFPLSDWRPNLSPASIERLYRELRLPEDAPDGQGQEVEGAALLAFHARLPFEEGSLERLVERSRHGGGQFPLGFMLNALGHDVSRKPPRSGRRPSTAIPPQDVP